MSTASTVAKMDYAQIVQERINHYDPQGKLDQTARVMMNLMGIKHPKVADHVRRVALLAEAVAIHLEKDGKAAFFAGLLHDIGKLVLPYPLFDGHEISAEEYAEVKQHALASFEALNDLHMFCALCAGLHHAMYQKGYGITMADIPTSIQPATAKKILEIAAIVSIVDFIEAYTFRKTKILDGSGNAPSLEEMLKTKYPDDHIIIAIALNKMGQVWQLPE